jgi:hypothetical protein
MKSIAPTGSVAPSTAFQPISSGKWDSTPSLGLYEIASGYEITSAYDGRQQRAAFCLEERVFLQVLRDLKANSIAAVNADAVHVVQAGSWDHSYSSPEERAYASLQRGRLVGLLEIRGPRITHFDLQFSPSAEKREVRSDMHSTIGKDVLREALRSLK